MPTGRLATAWLSDVEPAPPASLAARVAEHLGDAPFESVPEAARRCVDSAERVVARLLDADDTTRGSALDLLAADALATYAFELAAEAPESLPALTGEAMARFAALAARGPRTGVPASGDPADGEPASGGADA